MDVQNITDLRIVNKTSTVGKDVSQTFFFFFETKKRFKNVSETFFETKNRYRNVFRNEKLFRKRFSVPKLFKIFF